MDKRMDKRAYHRRSQRSSTRTIFVPLELGHLATAGRAVARRAREAWRL